MKINRSEVLRYMGWRKGEPNDTVLQLIESICTEFEKSTTPRYAYRKVSIYTENNKVTADGTVFESEKLSKHLKNVTDGIILSATLGTEADNIIRKESVLGTLNASIAQAVGTAMIEDFSDEVCRNLEKEFNTSFLPRFSPGYGDWDLASQDTVLALCDAKKRIGITLTDSFMMIPTKSVTAIVGFSDSIKTEKHDCRNCNKKDCEFRR